MPKINRQEYDQAQAQTGEFERMGAGGYVLMIQAVRTNGTDGRGRKIDYIADKQYVKLIYDVCEGDFAGKFSDDYWAGEEKDYGHVIYMSWKSWGPLKNTLKCFEQSNPGFDAEAAFEADNWALFIGKKIGAVFGEEEYRANDGTVKTRLGFPRIKSMQAIHEGRFRVPATVKLKDDNEGYYAAGSSTPSGSGGSVYDDDIPFL